MTDDNYRIQELLQREVYVGSNLVGTIVGERYHPNEDRVRSMRIQVQPNVAEEYMRKPAEHAPLSKELIHSIPSTNYILEMKVKARKFRHRLKHVFILLNSAYDPKIFRNTDPSPDRILLDSHNLERIQIESV